MQLRQSDVGGNFQPSPNRRLEMSQIDAQDVDTVRRPGFGGFPGSHEDSFQLLRAIPMIVVLYARQSYVNARPR